MIHGKTIEMFLVNGTADSLITAEMSNWNGKAIKIPRIEVSACKREDISQAGVYFLFCKEDDGTDEVYIGEAENVKERLIQHIRDYPEKEKYEWNTAVIFIGNDLNKALIRYLENRLVETARNCNRYKVLTKNTFKNTVMKESQIAAMEEFIDNVQILINALGYKVLEPLIHFDQNDNGVDDVLFHIKKPNVDASGRVTSEGFVLLKDSVIDADKAVKSLSANIVRLREKYISEGKVVNKITTEDILFTSSSAAADFVLGFGVSGPGTWTDNSGRTLKEIEGQETNL